MVKDIIVPTGYMGSGSSAVTDLLKEYPELNTKNSDFEYIFLHAPGGVFDLENKLLNNNNAVRSDEAIKEFRKFMYRLNEYQGWWPAGYKYMISNNFKNIVDLYISSLVQYSFEGSWYIYENPSKFVWLKNAALNRIYSTINRTRYKKRDLEILEFSLIKDEEFYEKTKQFIYDIVNEIAEGYKQIVLDQFILPYNLKKIENYKLEGLKPIIVRRDPRDVFILNKYYWYTRGENVPFPLEVSSFCSYYKSLRAYEQTSKLKYLKINFEDLVLNYEETVKEIENYLGLDSNQHKNKKQFFNPDKSINNLKVFKRNIGWENEVKKIEEDLKEYLYEFPENISFNSNDIF